MQIQINMNKKIWLIIAAIVVVAIFISMAFIPFEISIIKEVYSYVVDEVVSVTGLSQTLVRGIVILLLLPLLWIIPVLVKRRHNYNKFAWAGVMVYVAVFFLSIFYFSQSIYFRHDKKATLKWYALTPDGVKYYDTPGIDPVYGIELKPLTPDVVRKLKLLEKGDFKPIDPEKVSLFNPITGEPQAWYSRTASNVYEFYDKPGYHPRSGVPLLPVTKEVYSEWMNSKSIVAADKHVDSSANIVQETSKERKSKEKEVVKKSQRSTGQKNSVIKEEDW
jgi:hypothetical protein